jgi:uncharacterized cysteine cluster protein YcgN (CxxCxxCC family)
MIQVNKNRLGSVTTTCGVYDDTQVIKKDAVKMKKIINGEKWIDVTLKSCDYNRCSTTFDLTVKYPNLDSGEYIFKFYSKDFNTVYTTLANVL